jgi:hypothetical protein
VIPIVTTEGVTRVGIGETITDGTAGAITAGIGTAITIETGITIVGTTPS